MRRSRLAAALITLSLAVACTAPPPVVTVPTTPQHPDYVFPVSPEGTPQATLDRLARSWRLLQANDLSAAEREVTALVAGARTFAPARTAAGYVALAQKKPADALPQFDAALTSAAAPYAPALVGRGFALLSLNREEDALRSLERGLAADASIPDLAERVATLRVRVVQDRINRAQRAAAAGRWEDARTAYRAAIEASPEAAFLYRDLASVERRAGREETALELARAALVYDPDDVRAHVLIGDVLAERGEYEEAIAAYTRAAAIDPTPAIETTLARLRDRAREAALPAEYQSIGARPQATRADLAAVLGVRLAAALGQVTPRQVVLTDVRGHWAETWIQAVSRTGAMEVYSNYTFQPAAPLRRADLADAVSRTLGVIAPPSSVSAWDAATLTISDVPPAHLAFPAVRRAVASGVLRLNAGAFDLLVPVTGAELQEAVARLATVSGARR